MPDSRMSGFGKGPSQDRISRLISGGWITGAEATLLEAGPCGARRLSEAVVGECRLPLSLIPNARINGQELLIPFATEEASVVAGASRLAVLLRSRDGIRAAPGGRRISAQVLVEGGDPKAWLAGRAATLIPELDAGHPSLCAAGGGVEGLEVLNLSSGAVLKIELRVGDAMGANVADHIAEAVGRTWEAEVEGGRAVAAIVSNWPVGPTASAEVDLPLDALARRSRDGSTVAEDIVRMSLWAASDPRRRATHLKGTMNGISGVLAAFRQDLRAADTAAQAAVWNGIEGVTIPTWAIRGDQLHGHVALPVPCGIAGRGQDDPALGLLRRLAGIRTGGDLEVVALATGLLTNLAALQVLVTEGIVSGHGRLHAAHDRPEDR